MKYTLRQLEVFLATAFHENLTRAAASLSMSQSAASSALKDLESQFDVQLFDRVGKRLQLNELGESIRPRAEALLEQARGLESALARHQELGHLRVGATLSIGNYLAVEIMARYMGEQAGARVELEVANTEAIVRKVANFELDLGLIEGESRHPDLEMIHWRDDELVVFCAPDHPLAGKPWLTDDDLLSAAWIVREPGSGTRQHFEWAMHGLLPELNIKLELQHTEAIKRAVEAGLGVGCLSEITLVDAFKRGRLVPLPVPHRDFHRRFYFALHRQKFRSAGVERWLALCRESTEGLA
ncbi:LysR family transcriptional regulator [Halopseudomonas aestusnigri]|jgi:DNA-binding transcriptional LysR family regulator|uniref:LysR family transcriptional regulator n=1 Tax=Halopseudomonas TaxID=2901189 RepID=UPI000C8FA9E6|nr:MULTISPECIES: LysR family transcriptional regulator [Halopseudomonas]MAP78049.1 LysR family transcriptional regulator [Pseudomonadales bacterium]MEE2800143.1 LysR family transcriptional regulator [Pseudomonadota bacterium]HBT57531.1 LysR family transcriptional regulator [Pseudomonas sp.]MDL2198231.1 LysR family transcriptional regulator [Halopseudomonas aestusnigri]BDX20314.1 transcriptional regulator [Halopseudomonas aestusnigri]|tara:strand:- start:5103 stop:5996 length:894 start_codon:yes stop_codon:yes gene_type:complete